MPNLRTEAGSSTPKQRKTIGATARRIGLTIAEVRDWYHVQSLCDLSSAQASECIQRLGGGELPRPPGTGSRPSARAVRGSRRMITEAQVREIDKLLDDYFNDGIDARRKKTAWLQKIYRVDQVRDIGTSQAANRCIWSLRRMIKERADRVAPLWKEAT